MVSDKYRVEIVDASYYRSVISCQNACPTHTDARGYVNAVASGHYQEGYIMARQPNPFASTCGRVCNAPCEAACRRGNIDAPISIRALKRFLCERYGVEAKEHLAIVRAPGEERGAELLVGRTPGNSNTAESLGAVLRASARMEPRRRKAKVAVIGSGPAGLTAAHDLAVLGYEVVIFEASPVPGGMLILGIPEYRLPRSLIRFEIEEIMRQGVELKVNMRLGKDFSLRTLREEGYEAIFIAVGLYRSHELDIEGINLDGVLRAIEFLLNVNMGYKVELGQKVLIIGGGAVAMDVARAVARVREPKPLLQDGEVATALGVARGALRLGVPEVHVLCLERREEMPTSLEEVEDALDEGVILHTSQGPNRILGDGQRVTGLETVAVASVFDSQGRFSPTFIPGTESVIEGDTVILAVGQTSDLSFIGKDDGIEVTPRGTIAVDPETLATTAPGIFTGGDVAFGPRLIIEAVKDGHTAARAIDRYLQKGRVGILQRAAMRKVTPQELPGEGWLDIPKRRPPLLPLERRTGVSEVELAYDEDMAMEQASRCLKCHIQTVFNGDLCILCGGCVDVCPWNCFKMVRLDKIEGEQKIKDTIQAKYGMPLEAFQGGSEALNLGTAMIKDETRCTRCGLCAERCPTGALTMEAFSFEEELVYEESTGKTPEYAGVKQ